MSRWKFEEYTSGINSHSWIRSEYQSTKDRTDLRIAPLAMSLGALGRGTNQNRVRLKSCLSLVHTALRRL